MKNIKNIIIVILLSVAAFSACKKDDDAEPEAITIPNAFTPNGDNLNDSFKVVGRDIVKFEINIYDPNNLIIYHSKNIKEGWDGTFNNKPMPQGTYSYLIEYELSGGSKHKISGSLELIRN